MQGLHFEVVVSSFAEDLDKNNFEHPFEYAKETARKKTLQVATQLQSEKVGWSLLQVNWLLDKWSAFLKCDVLMFINLT